MKNKIVDQKWVVPVALLILALVPGKVLADEPAVPTDPSISEVATPSQTDHPYNLGEFHKDEGFHPSKEDGSPAVVPETNSGEALKDFNLLPKTEPGEGVVEKPEMNLGEALKMAGIVPGQAKKPLTERSVPRMPF
jgi:hypothetical protein